MSESERFSLTRVRLRQYRSIAEADVAVGPLLFLVGPNGSGKSNFLDALRLVSESLLTSLDQALRARGGVAEVRRRSTGHPTHFGINVDFEGRGFEGEFGFDVAAVKGGGFRISRESCGIWFDDRSDEGHRYADAAYVVKDGKLDSSTESVMPPVSDQRLTLVAAAGLDVFLPVYEGLSRIGVYNISPDAMRLPHSPDSGELLLRDGANAASVVRAMERTAGGRLAKERIEEYLGLIVPGMHGVSASELGTWETLEFKQDVPGAQAPWNFQAQSVSDGTLRALGVLIALFNDTVGVHSTVGIEEPETALHPAAAGVLLDALRDASDRRQIIVTSHSPDLMDRDDFQLADIRAVRSDSGRTVIDQLDEAGAHALLENLFTPGELLRTDQLLPQAAGRGGVR